MRNIVLVLHPTRKEAHQLASEIVPNLRKIGFQVATSSEGINEADLRSDSEILSLAKDAELILVLGGDGTILRGAEIAHGSETPVLGINLGHV